MNSLPTIQAEQSATAATDELSSFAPGLDHHLRRIFTATSTEYETLRTLFNYCFKCGGREEPCMPRRADESYNPRLARIAQLLISHSQENSFEVFATTFLAVTNTQHLSAAPVDARIRNLARHLPVTLNNTPQAAPPGAAAITLALTLDQVRHLHQSQRSPADSLQLLADARRLLDLPLTEARYIPLKTLLSHAISQQERRCRHS